MEKYGRTTFGGGNFALNSYYYLAAITAVEVGVVLATLFYRRDAATVFEALHLDHHTGDLEDTRLSLATLRLLDDTLGLLEDPRNGVDPQVLRDLEIDQYPQMYEPLGMPRNAGVRGQQGRPVNQGIEMAGNPGIRVQQGMPIVPGMEMGENPGMRLDPGMRIQQGVPRDPGMEMGGDPGKRLDPGMREQQEPVDRGMDQLPKKQSNGWFNGNRVEVKSLEDLRSGFNSAPAALPVFDIAADECCLTTWKVNPAEKSNNEEAFTPNAKKYTKNIYQLDNEQLQHLLLSSRLKSNLAKKNADMKKFKPFNVPRNWIAVGGDISSHNVLINLH